MISRRFHLIVVLLLLLSSALAWLMHSQAALQWLWQRLESASQGLVTAERVEGVLAGPIELHGLAIHLPRADIRLSRVRFDWHPGRLLVGRFSAIELGSERVEVELKPDDGVVRPPFTALAAPLASTIARLSVGELVVRHYNGLELRFKEIAVNGLDWHDEALWVEQLHVLTPWGSVDGHGRLATARTAPLDFYTDSVLSLPAFDRALPLSGHLGGTLEKLELSQRSHGTLAGEVHGSITLLDTLGWQAEGDLLPFPLSHLRSSWRPLRVGGHLQGEGDFHHNHLRGAVTLDDPALGAWRGEAELEQQQERITVHRATLQGVGHRGTLAGHGKLRLAGAPDYVSDASLDLQWRNIGWPLQGAQEAWHSEEGQAHLSGSLNAYQISTDLALSAPAYPASRWQLEGEGDLHHVTSRSLRLQGLAGSAQGEASLSWSPQLAWHVRLHGQGLDPALQWPQWPGRLDLDIASDGVWGDVHGIRIELYELQGELRERPLKGRGRVDYQGGRWQLSALQLEQGTARFSASGQIAAPWGIEWQLSAPQLSHLLPDSAGALQLKGSVIGELQRPHLALSASGSGLRWQEWRMANGSLDADVDLASHQPWYLNAQLQGVMRGEQALFDGATLQGEGSSEAHHLALHAASGQGSVGLELDGSYRAGQWQGALHDGNWRIDESNVWSQETPATANVAAAGATLSPFCWRSGEARACVALQAEGDGGRQFTASLHGLPLSFFSRWLPRNDLRFAGNIVAEAHARFDTGLRDMVLEAHVEQGSLRYSHPLDRAIELRFKEFSAAVHGDDAGSRARLAMTLDNGDTMRLEGRLPGWLPGRPLQSEQAVSGEAQLSMRDLEWLTIMVPEILSPQGRVTAQLNLAGTVADPRLTGNLALADGSVAIPRAGVTLQQIGVAASSPDGVSLRLAGAARSGPGWVTLEGSVHGETLKKWRSELLLRGDRFEVVRLPSVHLLASPEVRVAIEPYRVELAGTLRVPEADIRLPELPTTVRSSSDVVLVDEEAEAQRRARWQIASRLTLQLGEFIRVEGYGFKGRVGGQLTIDERPDQPAIGQGELLVREGRYKAYGQDLTIENGRLLFANSLLDDPGLDVRASRQVEEVKVGVNITGRLQRPELRLFSEPAMEESDALAYLVLGHPLRNASSSEATTVTAAATSLGLVGGERIAKVIGNEFGIDEVSLGTEYGAQDTALLLGKYLSPRLYVQYAVVFSSALNVTRLRYELSKNWFIKAESGEQQSADILYTFEH